MNYDFHNCFSPAEFERFVCDILELREGRKFESFGAGADGGIDLRSEINGDIAICQVKCVQQNFSQLFSTPKRSEVTKAKRLAPQRYILAASISFLPQQKEKIRSLFAPYIHSNDDIIGRDELNKLLGQQKYQPVERRHYKLWLTSSNVLLTLLAAEHRRGEYNETTAQLEEMQKHLPRYVPNRTFPEALSILEHKHFVLITGPPGIGKTMLGQALAAHFIEQRKFEFVFVRGSVKTAWGQYDTSKQQVFLMDDFWGSVFERDSSNRNEDKSLLSFMHKVEGDSSKALILTSREYVFQRGSQRKNYAELGQFLSRTKCMITHESFSGMDRAKILYNHLYFSNLPKHCIQDIVDEDRFLRVINHPDYTPRAIEQFIDREFGRNDSTYLRFSDEFINYLSDPYEYWIEAFEKQNDTAKLILLILAISNPPMRWSALFNTIKSAIGHAARFGLIIDASQVDESLKELDRTFVLTKDYYGKDLRVDFQNPSLVDVMLRYLKTKMESWGEILLRSAIFFNQLDFSFSTNSDGPSSVGTGYVTYENEYSAGEKIVLRENQAAILRQRILTDFDSLGFTAIDPYSEFVYSQYSGADETQAAKLIRLTQLFEPQAYPDVASFVCDRFRRIEQDLFSDKCNSIAKPVLDEIPRLIATVKPFLSLDAERLVAQCYHAATFVIEIICWAELDDIFPLEYRAFVKSNLTKIRRRIRELIVWDAEWYYEEDDDYNLDMLFEWQIDEVLKLFSMRKSKTLIRRAEVAAGWDDRDNTEGDSEARENSSSIPKNKEEPFDEDRVRNDFSSLVDTSAYNYLESERLEGFITSHTNDESRKGRALERCRSEDYSDIATDSLLVELLCKHFDEMDLDLSSRDAIAAITELELLSNVIGRAANFSSRDWLNLFANICFERFFGSSASFAEKIAELHEASGLRSRGFQIEELYEILIPFFEYDCGEWKMVSDEIGRHYACEHLFKRDQAARFWFYQNEFPRFSDEEVLPVNWWSAFFENDRTVFVDAFLDTVGESTLTPIGDAPTDQRFLILLKMLGLKFDLLLGVPEMERNKSHSITVSRQVEFLEFADIGLSDIETADFVIESLSEGDADCLATESAYFKDVAKDKWSGHPDARLVRIDFNQLITTPEKESVIKRLGDRFSFAAKFENLQRGFDSMRGRLQASEIHPC